MKDTILSLVRHGLTFGGGLLVAKGLLSDGTSAELAGILATAIGALWGALDEYRAAKKTASE